jgi:phage shock protein A
MKEKLQNKISKNEEILKDLISKKENLERQISNLENKIRNQKFALDHLTKEN